MTARWLVLALALGCAPEAEEPAPPGAEPTEPPAPTTSWTDPLDRDGDGFDDAARGGTDCADLVATIHPGAPEGCNGVDDDCDGLVDDADPVIDGEGVEALYGDGDADGWGGADVRQGCAPLPGEVWVGGDCADDDPLRGPDAPETCDGEDDDCDGLVDDEDASLDPAGAGPWYTDVDGDLYGDPASAALACERPPGQVANGDDCDPVDPSVGPAAAWWPDTDGDGWGAGASVIACVAPADHVGNADDCDDADPDLSPDTRWYLDADLDGFGDAAVWQDSCPQPLAHVRDATDCDDADRNRNPLAIRYADADGDGYGPTGAPLGGCDASQPSAPDPGDCDDADPWTSPGSPELCDGVDNDCDGPIDEDAAAVAWWADADGDGWGDPASEQQSCAPVTAHVRNALDCDDTDPTLHPGDADADGIASCAGDCDDLDPLVWPGAPEACGEERDCSPHHAVAFDPSTEVLASGVATGSVVAADLDGDGDGDVVYGVYESDGVSMMENLGDGTFGPEVIVGFGADNVSVVRADDLDGDGDPDIVFSSRFGPIRIGWFENLGGLAFGAVAAVSTTVETSTVGAADIDTDGDLDPLATGWTFALFENLGAGLFGPEQAIASSAIFTEELTAADFDGDGDPDLVGVDSDGRILAFENLGAWAFGPEVELGTVPSETVSLDTADLDGDGLPEVLVAASGDGTVSYFPNLGDGTFGAEIVISTTVAVAASVGTADLDNDGDRDVIASALSDLMVVWFENLGVGFGPQTLIGLAGGPTDAAFTDVEGDGLVDVIVAAALSDELVLIRGSGCP